MNGEYDSTSKDLLEVAPADLLAWLGQPRPPERVRTIDADVSTVATAADKVIWIDDPEPWILHVEFVTYWDEDLPLSVLVRNALLRKRHKVSVVSVAILIRPAANASTITGALRTQAPIGRTWEFPYEVIRLWNEPADELVKAPLTMLPYAPLGKVDVTSLSAIIDRMKERIAAEASPTLAKTLWAATFILLGLKYDEEMIKSLLSGVSEMRESVTYQAILKEGRAEGSANEARKILLTQGRKRFGPPNPAVEAAINETTEIEYLEKLIDKLYEVHSWEDLLNAN